MNVVSVVNEVIVVTNSMIRELALPDFASGAQGLPESVRISAFDELNGMFQRDVRGGSDH